MVLRQSSGSRYAVVGRREAGGNDVPQQENTGIRVKEAVACLHPRRTRFSGVSGDEKRNRFNHLLLEFGERHLHDWAVVASSTLGSASTMNQHTTTKNGQGGIPGVIGSDSTSSTLPKSHGGTLFPMTSSSFKNSDKIQSTSYSHASNSSTQKLNEPSSTCMGCIEGRLRLCSNSLVFEPDDWSRGIIRIPFNKIEGLPTLMKSHLSSGNHSLQGESSSLTSSLDQTVVVKSRRHLVMKTNNMITPFDNYELYTIFRFTFVHSSPIDFLDLTRLLVDAQQAKENDNDLNNTQTPQKAKRSASVIVQQIVQPTMDRPFDPANFCDVRETPLTANLRCSVLSPLLSQPGCAIVTNTHIYHQPLSGIATRKGPGSTPSTHYHRQGSGSMQGLASKARHWALKDIIGYARRYNNGLKDSGLELFWCNDCGGNNGNDGKIQVTPNRTNSVLLAFDTPSDRERVIRFLPPNIICHTDRDFVLKAIQQWQLGKLSNYEYLLALNSAAGRTFHDLSRYPVFPWIIKDYKSSKLRLSERPDKTFRDLSKPIGALDEKRLEYFLSRYESMKEAGSMDEPFIYGTHYSAPGYVLYYLVRNMPEHMLCLQNGKFDSPDRMFHSVEHCYSSVLTNHADVKELIPEFYDTEGSAGCDFLLNARNLNLGITQNGERLHDVILPPWARSAKDFIRKNRKALECHYISQKLPQWIDLIFGIKSRGKEAQRANNLFHNMAYLGPSDLRHMKTSEERAQAELQATEFGIVPDQLFSAIHPQKISLDDTTSSVIVELVDENSNVVSKGIFDEREDYLDLGDGDRDAKLAGTGDQPWEILDSPTKSMKSMEEDEQQQQQQDGYSSSSKVEQRDRGTSIDSLSDRPWANEHPYIPTSSATKAAPSSGIRPRTGGGMSAVQSPHRQEYGGVMQKLTFSESNTTNSSSQGGGGGLGSKSSDSANSAPKYNGSTTTASTKGSWLSRNLVGRNASNGMVPSTYDDPNTSYSGR